MIEDLWYKNSVIYSLDVKTFMDANGDGIGDLEGLMRRLDYLEALGVDAVWLGPFQPTPNRDNGYDISDFYGADETHGSSGDFVEFVHHARQRGIKVMMDLVINHTSNEHRWFQEARRDEGSRYRAWFVWSKDRPANWDKGMVFPGVQKATWTYDEEAKLYYFHRFYEFQPDLNADNPEVRKEMRRIIGFWLQMGVDGFRVDAVPFIIESIIPGKEGERHFEYLYELRSFIQWRSGNAILIGEANVLPHENKDYFGPTGNGIQMMFNFLVNQNLFYALASGQVAPLAEALEATRLENPANQWGHFLRNHDELDLGRLTEEQRQQVFSEMGPEKDMQLYDRGIRRRLAPMLKNDRRRIELAYSSIFAFPGSPVLRYGDEIGMGDDLSLKERDSVRTPMQWGDEAQGGFSVGEKVVHPVIDKGEFGYKQLNVEKQRRDPNSLLNWTGKMIRMRKECPEIGWGEWKLLETGSPTVLAILYEWRGNAMVVVHNYAGQDQSVTIKPDVERGETLVNLIVDDTSRADQSGKHQLSLEPYGYRWYRVGDLNHVLRRETIGQIVK